MAKQLEALINYATPYNIARIACIALAAFFIGAFLSIALLALGYPFHLEWMEGQNIDVIARIRQGLPVYTAPTIEYVPFIYAPLYYYVAAAMSFLTGGVEFLPARLVSLLATLGTGMLLYRWIKREGGNEAIGYVTIGLFYATYILSARWFDNSRVDSLSLLLTLGGLYIFYFYTGWRYAIIAATIFTAAFFTKQSTVIALLPPLAVGLLIDRQHSLRTLIVFAVMMAATLLIAHIATDGWFEFYTFIVPAGHGFDRGAWFGFWRWDLFNHLPILLCIAALTPLLIFSQDKQKGLWYFGMLAGFLASAYIARLHTLSYLNVLMPAHLILALMGGLAWLQLERSTRKEVVVFLPILLAVQLAFLHYNPLHYMPTQRAIEKGNRFLASIAKIDGDIFMPELQFVQTRVGKKSYDYGMAAFDIMRSNLGKRNNVKEGLRRELRQAFSEHRFSAIIPGYFIQTPAARRYYHFDHFLQYPPEYVAGAFDHMRVAVLVPGAPKKRMRRRQAACQADGAQCSAH